MATKKQPAKRAAKRARRTRAVPELDDLNYAGHPDNPAADEGLTLRLSPDGVASMWPASFDRLDAARRELASRLMLLIGERRNIGREIDELVGHMRSHGMSWVVIGWCVGTTAEAARQRWGGGDE